MEKKTRKLKPFELKKFYSMAMILVPSIVLVIVSMAEINFLARIIAQLLLFMLQVLVVKGILDDAITEF